MAHVLNMVHIFNCTDAKKASALATIAKYSEPDQVEASHIAQIYDRCDKTSIKHLSNVARVLADQFKPL